MVNLNTWISVESLGNIGVIKMEVSRSTEANEDFLKRVRKLSSENGIILIFDECTSGFRETFGGIHKKYCVDPDMAIFGKALGIGDAITAIIGKAIISLENLLLRQYYRLLNIDLFVKMIYLFRLTRLIF